MIRSVEKHGVNWDERTDLVVVGGGGAGLVAAAAAGKFDIDTLVLEKQETVGGNTAVSHGISLAAETIPQANCGIDDSAEEMARDLIQYTGYHEELTRRLAEESGDTINWLIEDVGLDFRVNPEIQVEACSVPRSHYPVYNDGTVPETGEPIIETLRDTALQRGVTIRTSTPVEQLVVKDDEIVGVVTEGAPRSDGGQQREMIRCQKVLLATNGITGNRELRLEKFPQTKGLEYWPSRGNTGDGFQWGNELGAAVDLNRWAVSLYPLVSQPEGFHLLIDLGKRDRTLIVNENAEQFGNINAVAAPLAFSYKILDQPRKHAYVIFDQQTHDELLESAYTEHRFEAALEQVTFSKSDTVTELAGQLELNKAALTETIDGVNHLAEAGETDSFGHTRQVPLEPPFYGTKVMPAVIENKGGLRTDTNARVVDEAGNSFQNLFAAGAVTCGISGLEAEQYVPGMRMLNVLSLGKIMGRCAATEAASQSD